MNNGDMPAMPPNAGWRDDVPTAQGLTKREYLAAMAMQGLLQSYPRTGEGYIARQSVIQSEALLAELEKAR